MLLKLFKRSRQTSAVSFADTYDHVYSSLYKRLVFSFRASPGEVAEICEAYISLWSSTTNEGRARAIYDGLVDTAKLTRKAYPLNWLVTEILFEAFACSSGDRQWAAQLELENNPYGSKEKALALYNERLARVL